MVVVRNLLLPEVDPVEVVEDVDGLTRFEADFKGARGLIFLCSTGKGVFDVIELDFVSLGLIFRVDVDDSVAVIDAALVTVDFFKRGLMFLDEVAEDVAEVADEDDPVLFVGLIVVSVDAFEAVETLTDVDGFVADRGLVFLTDEPVEEAEAVAGAILLVLGLVIEDLIVPRGLIFLVLDAGIAVDELVIAADLTNARGLIFRTGEVATGATVVGGAVTDEFS